MIRIDKFTIGGKDLLVVQYIDGLSDPEKVRQLVALVNRHALAVAIPVRRIYEQPATGGDTTFAWAIGGGAKVDLAGEPARRRWRFWR